MADASEIASYGGATTTFIALVVALADYLRKRNGTNLGNKMEKAAPSPTIDVDAHLRALNERQIVFERGPAPYSPDLIARVESYVRAEGDLRIQLARKDWELGEMLRQRDAALALVDIKEKALRAADAELKELRRQMK